MKVYSPGDLVKFKSDHGTVVEGTVYDSSDVAVMITTHFGVYSVSPEKIISGGTWKITVNTVKKDKSFSTDDCSYDIGWWDTNYDDGDVD